MRHVRWDVQRLSRTDLELLLAERGARPTLDDEQDLLLRVRMLVRAFARLIAEQPELDVLTGDQLAEGARVLRSDQLVAHVAQLNEWHSGSDLVYKLLLKRGLCHA